MCPVAGTHHACVRNYACDHIVCIYIEYSFLVAKDQRRQTLKKQPKKQESTNYVDPFENTENSVKGEMLPGGGSSGGTRHWSISGLRTKFSFRKAQSLTVPMRDSQDDASYTRRRDRSKTASTFYDDENMSVTKNVSEPADFTPLELRGKSMNELLMLLKPVSHSAV